MAMSTLVLSPVLIAMDQRGVDRDRGVEAGADVADRHADARRRLALVAGDAHDAAHALHDHVVGGVLRVRAGVAEARGRGVDQLGIPLVQRVPAVAQLLHRAGPEVLDDDVGLLEQLLEDRAVLVVLEVERDRFLAAVDRGEVGRLAVDERAVGAGVVAALGRLDLDHPGAHLRHQEGAVGAGEDARQVDDGDARQGAGGTLGHATVLASGLARIQPHVRRGGHRSRSRRPAGSGRPASRRRKPTPRSGPARARAGRAAPRGPAGMRLSAAM